jgi:FixJ family two-component response regulator
LSKVRPLIAIVDDEESIRRALSRLLRASGLENRTFSSGIDFLESLNESPFDCVVLDIHMPRLGGFEVQESLARANARIPVIVITGRDSDETREQVMAAGAVAYLRKPIEDQILLSAVATALADDPDTDGQ